MYVYIYMCVCQYIYMYQYMYISFWKDNCKDLEISGDAELSAVTAWGIQEPSSWALRGKSSVWRSCIAGRGYSPGKLVGQKPGNFRQPNIGGTLW